jgi:hypothetical protein
MRLVTRTPSAALSPFVRTLWYFEGPDLAHERERKLPQTEMQLLVNLHEDEVRGWDGSALSNEQRTHGAAVSGLYSGPFAIDTAEQRRVVGAVVRPGAAPALFCVAADELASRHVALDALWGAAGTRLRERLLEAPSPLAILETLDECLTDRLAGQLGARSPLARLAPSECIVYSRRSEVAGRCPGPSSPSNTATTTRRI